MHQQSLSTAGQITSGKRNRLLLNTKSSFINSNCNCNSKRKMFTKTTLIHTHTRTCTRTFTLTHDNGKSFRKASCYESKCCTNRERQSDRLCLTVTSRTFSWPSHKADSTASLTCNFWRLCCCVCSPQGLLLFQTTTWFGITCMHLGSQTLLWI